MDRGMVRVPLDRPGIGVDVDAARIAALTVRTERLRAVSGGPSGSRPPIAACSSSCGATCTGTPNSRGTRRGTQETLERALRDAGIADVRRDRAHGAGGPRARP